MRRVAGVSPLSISPMTWGTAVAVAAVCVVAALYVADRLTPANQQSAARAPASPRLAAILLEPSQSAGRKAESAHKKTAPPKTGDKIETLVTPGLFEPGVLETPEAWAPIEPDTGEEDGAPRVRVSPIEGVVANIKASGEAPPLQH